MLNVSAITSTKIGVAPNQATTSAVAAKVKDGTRIAWPGPAPFAISASPSASVPLAQLSTCLAPQNSASWCSSLATSGPRMNRP